MIMSENVSEVRARIQRGPISTQEAVRRITEAGVRARCASPLDIEVEPHGFLPIGDPRVTTLLDRVVGHNINPHQIWDVFQALANIDAFLDTREYFDTRSAQQ